MSLTLEQVNITFSPTLFWDTDVNKLDFERNRRQIITRTFMRGRIEDFRQVLTFYGMERCREELTQARYLDKITLAFCCALFDLSKDDFRCYRLSQSIPQHWPY